MRKTENGAAVVVAILGLVAAGGIIFGLVGFMGKQSAQNSTQKKIAVAVATAQASQKTLLEAQFADRESSPTVTFTSSAAYGSISFNYPKSWSAYVDRSGVSEPINGYYNPGEIPGATSSSVFAMRVELTSVPYNNALQLYTNQAKQGLITATAYLPPKINGLPNAQPGTFIEGPIREGSATFQGQMAILPVRDKTLQIYTLSSDYLNDFNNVVLASLTYSP